jgi:hypothetical protein
MLERLTEAWSDIEEPLQAGAIVIIEESATRIRGLPIGRSA